MILIVWFLLVTTYMVGIMFIGLVKIVAIFLITVICLLSIQLMIVNYILMKQLNTLFPTKEASRKFRREKCFLISTLVLFTISYIIVVLRNIFFFNLITGGDGNDTVGDYVC